MTTLISFGFKYGKPKADLVYDVRLQIRNRYREWKGMTGCHPDITKAAWREGKDFIRWMGDQIEDRLRTTADLAVAVGCVGGKHRSVASVEMLGMVLKAKGIPYLTVHRDIGV